MIHTISHAIGRKVAPVALIYDAVVVDDNDSLRRTFLVESLPEGHMATRVRLMIEMRGVDPVDLLLCDRESEHHVASGDGVVFPLLEAENVRSILAVGSQPSHDRAG